MQSKAATVQQYLSSLPADRRAAVEAVRAVILANLDRQNLEEGMQYGMIGYYVPHRVYPAGYHCDPRQPLPYAGLAAQKQAISLYLMSCYNNPKNEQWLRAAWAKTGKKLDMGKSCIRFKRIEDIPLEVVGEAIRRVPAKAYIARYEELLMSTAAGAKAMKKAQAAAKPDQTPTTKATTKAAAKQTATEKPPAKATSKKAATKKATKVTTATSATKKTTAKATTATAATKKTAAKATTATAATKKTTATKAPATKAPATEKTAAKQTATKKTATKQTPATKATATKAPATKTTATKAPAAKKTATKAPAAKKTAAKKTAAKKTATQEPATKQAPATKTATRKTAKKQRP